MALFPKTFSYYHYSQFLLLILSLTLLSSTTPTPTPTPTHDSSFTTTTTTTATREQKLTRLRLFWHDIVSGPNPTSVRVVNPVSPKSPTAFGLISMIDDPLTEGPTMASKLVGRAQGFYASACQSNVGLLMNMNFAIMEGKYNGSTFAVLGRNTVMSKVREMAVVGGSGLFRFATGYVQAKTHSLNYSTGDAVVQYDCFIMHY